MPDYLSKSQIVSHITEDEWISSSDVRRVLDALVALAASETAAGNDFVIPGICKLAYSYRPPKAKGERWKNGEEVTGFGGIVSVKDSDSPEQKAKVSLKASLTGAVGRNRISAAEMGAFLKSRAGKTVIARKSK